MTGIYNSFAEFMVLGTILANPKAAFGMEMLAADDFVIPGNRTVFDAMAMVAADGRQPLFASVAPALASKTINDQPALQTVMKMVREKLPIEDFVGAIQSLKEYSGRRTMVTIADQMGQAAKNFDAPILPFNEEVVATLDDISATMRHAKVTAYDLGDLMAKTVADLRLGKQSNLITTGLIDLDREIGGWPRGEVSIIAGRSSMGKTTVALSCLRQAAQKGVRSLFFSMEMPGDKVAARMLSDAVFNSQTPIPYKAIIERKVRDWDIERLETMMDRLKDLPMRVDSQSGLTVSEVTARTRRYLDELSRTGDRLDVICVDHLGFVKPSTRYSGNRNLELGEITKAFKEIAKELDIAVILLCQLNREAEKRQGSRPQLSDLRESGQIEEDADIVIMCFREAYYLSRDKFEADKEEFERIAKLEIMENVTELIGVKTRNGPTFNKRFFCHMPSNAIRDAA